MSQRGYIDAIELLDDIVDFLDEIEEGEFEEEPELLRVRASELLVKSQDVLRDMNQEE